MYCQESRFKGIQGSSLNTYPTSRIKREASLKPLPLAQISSLDVSGTDSEFRKPYVFRPIRYSLTLVKHNEC
jgi:hypothetical protein